MEFPVDRVNGMAAKKTALAKSGDVLETMAKAGVEVKLTKTEIADYIAEKAQEEIQNEIADIQRQVKELHDNVSTVPTGKWKTLADAYNAATGKDYTYVMEYSDRSYGDVDRYLVTLGVRGSNGWVNGIANTELERKDVPADFLAAVELNKRIPELEKRLQSLQTKKHRILLIEKILSGTESGKVVLGDLTKMVNKIVKE